MKWWKLLRANGGRFEINQLLVADHTALVADTEEKLAEYEKEAGAFGDHGQRVWQSTRKKKIGSIYYEVHDVCKCGSNGCERKWIVLSTRVRKWQRMEDVTRMW